MTALLALLKNPAVLKYGAIILVILGIVGGTAYYIDKVRDEGYEAGRLYERDLWVKKENAAKAAQAEADRKHRAELEKVENDSKTAADQHKASMSKAEARIAELNRQLKDSKVDIACPVPPKPEQPNQPTPPSPGPTVTEDCKPGSVVQMGDDFSKAWNEYNKVQ